MAQETPGTTDIVAGSTTGSPRPPKQKRARAPLVRCGVCGERYRRLGRHVKAAHGLAPAQYARVFDHELSPTPHSPGTGPLAPHAGDDGLPGTLIHLLAERCAESPDFLDRLASDVGAHLLGSGMRTALAASLGALLQTRMQLAGDAAAQLARIDNELSAPWRLEAGGEMGAPTPTRDLAQMHQAASSELDRATDATLRACKLAIDERRGERGEAAGDAPLDRYRGTRDALPLPDALGPGERAIMLSLMERLATRAQRERTVIDAAAQDEQGEAPVIPTPPLVIPPPE